MEKCKYCDVEMELVVIGRNKLRYCNSCGRMTTIESNEWFEAVREITL